MIREFCDNYNSKIEDLQTYLGPCAKICCYEVKDDFIKKLDTYQSVVIKQKDGKSFFDLPLYNIKTLEQLGIKAKSINTIYNNCTICSPTHCSFRRDGYATKSQLNIVMLS